MGELTAPVSVDEPKKVTEAKTTPELAAPAHVVKSSATLSAGGPQVTLAEPGNEPTMVIEEVPTAERSVWQTFADWRHWLSAAWTNVGKAEKVTEANTTPEPASPMRVAEGTTTLSSAPLQEDTNAGIAEFMSLES